ncbi:hypothetical protein HYX19_00645 [Candidatus Woesearchaeota archaeon]|nr:hypothetical protein [Candidatus Woesearchaeota archaeon]
MALKDIVDRLYVGLMGDRVNLASKIIFAASTYSLIYGINHKTLPSFLFGYLGGYLSVSCFAYTTAGSGTLRYYNRTSKHIKQFRRLDPGFAKTLIEGTENRKFTGYCQLQGMYLAAKKYGQLDVFYEAKKKYSKNIIPNF